MSRARSVPAFIVANSAPWMNGTASRNATIESVGKPGRFVSAFSPPEFTASSNIGKSSGEDHVRRLADRADDRAAREQQDLLPECAHTGSITSFSPAAGSGSSPAPSSERPVFARKTSSSEGW